MVDGVSTLYRSIGAAELALLIRSGFRAFPASLAAQPVFYSVTDEDYAARTARDWNTRDAASGYVGYVTRFQVRSSFLARYPLRKAGGGGGGTGGDGTHSEYWIPAEHLAELNENLVGSIDIVAEFRPEAEVPDDTRES